MAVLTANMTSLRNAFNSRFPNRAKDSDGWIGDYAHSQGTSGHNPDDTSHDNAEWDGDSDNTSEVRAIDVDKDLNDPEVDMQNVIDHMRQLPNLNSVLRYMIYYKAKVGPRIYRAVNGFVPEVYKGSNPHDKHAHFSGAFSQAADNNAHFDWRFEEMGTVQLSDDDKNDIANLVLSKLRTSLANANEDPVGFQFRRVPWAYPMSSTETTLSVFRDLSTDVKAIKDHLGL